MTAQMPDLFHHLGRDFAVSAIDGTGLFDPADHGYQPAMSNSGCWRGYHCEYTLTDGRLTLTTLQLAGPADGTARPPVLSGIRPTRATFLLNHRYQGLTIPVPFTGRLLLAADSQHAGYLNMGFAPAWIHATVHELTFSEGHLTATRDRSTEAAATRDRLGPDGLRPSPSEPTEDWITRTFSRSFTYSLPGTE
ncbi:MAG TPA: hypothetical protein VN408_22720 [Actinoplanes sp.]|nr:hypothetical protein [Actinoplanes sp.]